MLRCGSVLPCILRCGSVQCSEIRNLTVRCGAVLKRAKVLRCGSVQFNRTEPIEKNAPYRTMGSSPEGLCSPAYYILRHTYDTWYYTQDTEYIRGTLIHLHTSARINAVRAPLFFIFLLWAAPSEGRRWYIRKPLHSWWYCIQKPPLSSQTRWSSRDTW